MVSENCGAISISAGSRPSSAARAFRILMRSSSSGHGRQPDSQPVAMETYIHQVYGLLRRETVDFEMEGQKRKIRFLNPELPLFNTKDPIALHLSAFGPRTRALTAKLKAGWIDFVGKVENGIKEVEAMTARSTPCPTPGRALWGSASR